MYPIYTIATKLIKLGGLGLSWFGTNPIHQDIHLICISVIKTFEYKKFSLIKENLIEKKAYIVDTMAIIVRAVGRNPTIIIMSYQHSCKKRTWAKTRSSNWDRVCENVLFNDTYGDLAIAVVLAKRE